jgi:hypothetical protein
MELTALADFMIKREKLVSELQRTARKVDEWWTGREDTEPTMNDLALLEGLLAERKTLLERLVKLDDVMLNQLVMARGQHDNSSGATPA